MRRRGIVMLLALGMMALLGIVLTVLSVRVQMVAKQTEAAMEAAQATQLLRAGVAVAGAQQSAGAPTNGRVASPVGDITLTWSPAPADRDCTIEVSLPNTRREVRVTFDVGGMTIKRGQG